MENENNRIQFENFLSNVAWIRKKYGISKRKMSKALKISVESLNKIENGILPPKISIDIVFNIYISFGIEPKAMFATNFEETSPFECCK